MPSLTTRRGLLGHFPRGADPPANDRRATTPPVRSLTSSSLRAISAAGAGGRGAWARASGRRDTREVGRGGAGGDDSEVWSGESGSSNATSDAESESEEAEEEPAPLKASPWGTQESGASGLRMGARAGGSGGRKATSGTADGGETRSRHGAGKNMAGKRDSAGVGKVTTPGEWGETLGAARPLEWAPIPTEWSGRREVARPPEWRKTPGGTAKE